MELTARAPQRRNAGSRPWDVGVAECRFKLTGAAMVRRSVWRCFALGFFVKKKKTVRMTAPSFKHRSRMCSNSAMQMDPRLAHSSLMWMLATVRTVTTIPSKVYEEYLREHGTWIDVHVKSRAKVSLLRRTAQRWVATWTFSASELPVTEPAPS